MNNKKSNNCCDHIDTTISIGVKGNSIEITDQKHHNKSPTHKKQDKENKKSNRNTKKQHSR